MESRQVLLNGVPIGHWDCHGRWVPLYGAAPYFPRPAMKRQQKLAVDAGVFRPRPLRNLDKYGHGVVRL
jgi:hypothetical protein